MESLPAKEEVQASSATDIVGDKTQATEDVKLSAKTEDGHQVGPNIISSKTEDGQVVVNDLARNIFWTINSEK